jgi:hypothetical protein|tara:strand:+ start:405 stop:701 length:297 start_codon:yes stop_codon:yes gene_type:complete
MIEHLEYIKVDISQKNGKIYCEVKVPKHGSTFKHKILIKAQHVAQLLELRGIKYGALEKNSLIQNTMDYPTEATWVFKKPTIPKKKSRSPKKTNITKE